MTYSYDGMGNLTGSSPGGISFTYNARNQTKTAGSDSYTYSGPDQRDRVQVNSDTFVYSGLGLSAKKDSGGNWTRYVRCSCGLLNNERTSDGKKYYYLFDGLGSIVGMTDSTGSEVNRYDYDPYGILLNQQEGVSNPWKYAGGYFDSATHLTKFGVRYYDATLGRWTQQDPVAGSLGDLNAVDRYGYAGDDLVNATDPSGKSVMSFLNCLGGWINGLITVVGFATIVFAIGAAIIGAIGSLNPLLGMFIFMGIVLAAALAIGAVGVNTYNSGVAPSCGYELLT